MTPRQLRRAAERKQRKADRKAGFSTTTITNNTTVAAAPPQNLALEESVQAPEQQQPTPHHENPQPSALPKPPLSEARLAANRANALLSKGGLTATSRAISAQNHTIHGLARHANGTFKLLETENPEAFAAARQALLDEHLPTTETETILVHNMAESHWLSQRAQRLQDTCMHPATGAITDPQNFSLYLRYYSTHQRNFHKCLQHLNKLRADHRKGELGFEAQRLKHDAQDMQKQKLEMKKVIIDAEVFIKEMVGRGEQARFMTEVLKARHANPELAAELEAELAKMAAEKEATRTAAQAA
jgi:hypothetical protein